MGTSKRGCRGLFSELAQRKRKGRQLRRPFFNPTDCGSLIANNGHRLCGTLWGRASRNRKYFRTNAPSRGARGAPQTRHARLTYVAPPHARTMPSPWHCRRFAARGRQNSCRCPWKLKWVFQKPASCRAGHLRPPPSGLPRSSRPGAAWRVCAITLATRIWAFGRTDLLPLLAVSHCGSAARASQVPPDASTPGTMRAKRRSS